MIASPSTINDKVESLSDEDFILLAKRFNALQTLEEKVRFVMVHSSNGEGIVTPLTRQINGKRYSYGFDVVGNLPPTEFIGEEEPIAKFLFQTLRDRMFKDYVTIFQAQLALCIGKLDMVNLLNAESRDQHEFAVLEANGYRRNEQFAFGYDAEKRKRDNVLTALFANQTDVLQDNAVFYHGVLECSRGAATYKKEMYLADLLDKVENGVSIRPAAKKTPLQESGYELADFIEPGLITHFLQVEARISKKVIAWKEGRRGSQIQCAGFCEALFVKGFFAGAKPEQTSVSHVLIAEFARWYYGIDITLQISSTKKKAREMWRDMFLNSSIWSSIKV